MAKGQTKTIQILCQIVEGDQMPTHHWLEVKIPQVFKIAAPFIKTF